MTLIKSIGVSVGLVLLVLENSWPQENSTVTNISAKYDTSTIQIEAHFPGKTYLIKGQRKIEPGFLGGNIRKEFGEFKEPLLELDQYKANKIRFATVYFLGLGLMVASAPLGISAESKEVFWGTLLGGLAVSMLGVKFGIDAQNNAFKFVWTYNKLSILGILSE